MLKIVRSREVVYVAVNFGERLAPVFVLAKGEILPHLLWKMIQRSSSPPRPNICSLMMRRTSGGSPSKLAVGLAGAMPRRRSGGDDRDLLFDENVLEDIHHLEQDKSGRSYACEEGWADLVGVVGDDGDQAMSCV